MQPGNASQTETHHSLSYPCSYQSEKVKMEEGNHPATTGNISDGLLLSQGTSPSATLQEVNSADLQKGIHLEDKSTGSNEEDEDEEDEEIEDMLSSLLTGAEEEEQEEEDEERGEDVHGTAIHSEEEAKYQRQEALKFYNKGEYDEAMKLQYPLVRYAVRRHDGVTDPRNGIYFLDYGLTQLRLLQTSSSVDDAFSEDKRKEAEKDMEACFINLDIARVCFQKQIGVLEEEEEERDEDKEAKPSSVAGTPSLPSTTPSRGNEDRLSRRVQVELTLAEVHNALAQLLVEKGDYTAALKEYDTELFIYQCLDDEYGNGTTGATARSATPPGDASHSHTVQKEEGKNILKVKEEKSTKASQNTEEEKKLSCSSFVAPPGRVVACLYGAADCFLKEADFEGAEERLQSALQLIRERYPPSIIDPALVEELEDWLAEAKEMKGGAYAAMQETIHQQFARDEMDHVLAQAEALSNALGGANNEDKLERLNGKAVHAGMEAGNISKESSHPLLGTESNEKEERNEPVVFHHSAVKKQRKLGDEEDKAPTTKKSSASGPVGSVTSHPFLSALPLQEENVYSSSTLPSQETSNAGLRFGSIVPCFPRGAAGSSNSSFTLGLSERSQSISLFPSQNINSQHSPLQSSISGESVSRSFHYDKDAGQEERSTRHRGRGDGQEKSETIHSAMVVKKPKALLSSSILAGSSLSDPSSLLDSGEMPRKKLHTE